MLAQVREKSKTTTCDCPACTGLVCMERPRFFAGQLLTEQELNDSQAYVLAKNRLHNRYLHGFGVVCGLQVSCHDCEGWVTVHPGYALDQCGNDVLVCKPHDFDLIAAIRACKESKRRDRECDPWREPFRKQCDDVEEKWCVTIRYREQEAQPTAALVSTSASTCGCGRAKNGNGKCGCGNGHNGGTKTKLANACEPTRVIEGYELGVICEPECAKEDDDKRTSTEALVAALEELGLHVPLTELSGCLATFTGFLKRGQAVAALLESNPFGNRLTIYSDLCKIRKDLRNLLLNNPHLTCELQERLALVVIPSPPDTTAGLDTWVGQIGQAMDEMGAVLLAWLIDCICFAALPACPADPCEDRLILACVTVRGDKIARICHTDCRRYTLTPHNLISAVLNLFLDGVCCGDTLDFRGGLRGDVIGNVSRPASYVASRSRLYSRFASTDIFSTLFAAGEGVKTKPAAEYVGRSAAEVKAALETEGVSVELATASWTLGDAVRSNLARPLVPEGERLRLYVDKDSGNVIGVAPLSETDRLQRELVAANKRISKLEKQLKKLVGPE